MSEEHINIKNFIKRHKFIVKNFNPKEILQIAVSISVIEEYSEKDLKKIIEVLSSETTMQDKGERK